MVGTQVDSVAIQYGKVTTKDPYFKSQCLRIIRVQEPQKNERTMLKSFVAGFENFLL